MRRLFQCLLYLPVERPVECLEYFVPTLFPCGYFIEILLFLGCKAVVQNIRKIRFQKIGYENPYILREKLALFASGILGADAFFYRIVF